MAMLNNQMVPKMKKTERFRSQVSGFSRRMQQMLLGKRIEIERQVDPRYSIPQNFGADGPAVPNMDSLGIITKTEKICSLRKKAFYFRHLLVALRVSCWDHWGPSPWRSMHLQLRNDPIVCWVDFSRLLADDNHIIAIKTWWHLELRIAFSRGKCGTRGRYLIETAQMISVL